VLIPNRSKRLFDERNVDCPAGLKTSSAYDAILFEEMGKPSRGVMEVTVICSLNFKDGKDGAGAALTWSQKEKTDFMTNFRDVCTAIWNEKFRITTTSTAAVVTDVGVIFNVIPSENMSTFSHSHWNTDVTKVPANWVVSSVGGGGGGFCWNGSSTLDSNDFRAETKGGPNTQRDAPHEFGHMLGNRDEYPAAKDNLLWLSDTDSIMYWGETVRERHYAMFAAWLTKQHRDLAIKAKKSIVFKVNGTTTIDNGNL